MKASEYRISSGEDAELFEQRLKEFCISRRVYMDDLGVSRAYTYLSATCFDKRCFSAYLEILLQDIALQEDINVICEKINLEHKTPSRDGFTENRMDRYIAASNVAHRIRAMWDKIMGLIVLLEHPKEYQRFANAKSRSATFKKIRKKHIENYRGHLDEVVEYLTSNLARIVENIDIINDNYRTSEAHSVGRILKWAFAKQTDDDDPFEFMVEAYNEIRNHLNKLISSIYLKAANSEAAGLQSILE
jgi:hypothetical protein